MSIVSVIGSLSSVSFQFLYKVVVLVDVVCVIFLALVVALLTAKPLDLKVHKHGIS